MTTLQKTPENKAKVSALKIVKETQWVGEVTHDTVNKALTAINLFQGTNSGWYNPVAIRLDGVKGIFMINENGGLNFESRIIKTEKGCRIEHLTNDGYNAFENKYNEILQA
jgi:hypothetical protein